MTALRPQPPEGPYVGRLAPSPTGAIHLGIARSSLLAWLDARLHRGKLILRIEDIDRGRKLPGAAEGIARDLRWLGLDWDEGPGRPGPSGPFLQSEREADYAAAIAQLEAQARIYPCTCSRKEIAAASAPHGPGDDGPRYPGSCRAGPTHPQRRAALRLRTEPGDRIRHQDLRLGPLDQDVHATVGDFILKRRDGLWAYQLAVTVDDLNQGVSCVLRGEDLASSTPRQLLLRRLLRRKAPPLATLHLPLAFDREGRRMAKRIGSATVQAEREAGKRPEQLIAELGAQLGLCEADRPTRPEALLEAYARWREDQLKAAPRGGAI